MMAYEHKPGQFSLFKNDKQGNEKRPDYTGDGMSLDGKPIKVSAWLKEGRNGSKFMSCSIQEKTNGEGQFNRQQEKNQQGAMADMDDDIPFAPIGKYL